MFTSTSVIICFVEVVVSFLRITALLISVSKRRQHWNRLNRKTIGIGRTEMVASSPPTIKTHSGYGVSTLFPYIVN